VRGQDRERRAEAAVMDAEDKLERDQARQVLRVPQAPGAYMLEGTEVRTLPQAESKVVTNKGRAILKVLSPIPIVSGKARVELDGERSQTVVATAQPEFYFRPVYVERFGVARLKPQKGVRVAARVTITPVTREMVEELDQVEVFRTQVDGDVYKIWPVNPLPPGEYAVFEYTEGKMNIQLWDFSCRPPAK
jgi:hypothetical protein